MWTKAGHSGQRGCDLAYGGRECRSLSNIQILNDHAYADKGLPRNRVVSKVPALGAAAWHTASPSPECVYIEAGTAVPIAASIWTTYVDIKCLSRSTPTPWSEIYMRFQMAG